MVILRTRNKITDFLMILAWASPFKGFWLEYCWLSVADDGPTLFHNWPNVSCYPNSGLSGEKVSPVWQSEQTRGNHPILFQCWASVEYDWPALNQQWVATLAQQWTGVEWVHCVAWMLTSKHKTLYYLCTTLYKCYTNVLCLLGWPAPAMEGIGLHVEDILVSLFISIIISWTLRILAHEEDQYTVMFTIY